MVIGILQTTPRSRGVLSGAKIYATAPKGRESPDLEAVLAQLDLPRDANNEILRFAEPEVLAQMLERAGFSSVRARSDTILFRYADLDQYWESTRGTGLRRWLDQLDAAQAAAVRAALEARVAPQRRADGLYLAATAVLAVAER